MPKRSLFIAAYDVVGDSRRQQVHRTVSAYASGGQKSVFECRLSPLERKTLLTQVRRLINEGEDRFALFRVEERTKPVLLGVATPPTDPSLYYVG